MKTLLVIFVLIGSVSGNAGWVSSGKQANTDAAPKTVVEKDKEIKSIKGKPCLVKPGQTIEELVKKTGCTPSDELQKK
jgi:hypothetical protein